MSNKTRAIKKNMKNKELFPIEMSCNILGSFLITLYITQATDATPRQLMKIYKEEKTRWINNDVDEEHWMQNIVSRINTMRENDNTYLPYGRMAMVKGQYNSLIAPLVNNRAMPLRQDGWLGNTLSHGMIYPIEEEPQYEVKDE